MLLTKKSLKRLSLVVKLKLSLRMFYGRNHDICVTDDHGYVKLVVVTILSFLLTYCPICRWHVGQQQRSSISVCPWPSFRLYLRCCSWSSSLLLQYASMCFLACHACAFLARYSTLFHFHDKSSHFNKK
jgi:hypothetical protein